MNYGPGPSGPDDGQFCGTRKLRTAENYKCRLSQKIAHFKKMIFEELSNCYLVLLLSNVDNITFDYLTLDI